VVETAQILPIVSTTNTSSDTFQRMVAFTQPQLSSTNPVLETAQILSIVSTTDTNSEALQTVVAFSQTSLRLNHILAGIVCPDIAESMTFIRLMRSTQHSFTLPLDVLWCASSKTLQNDKSTSF
jgi:hypothetical protein